MKPLSLGLVILPFMCQVALGNCDSLGQRVKILSADLSQQRGLISKYQGEIKDLTEQIADASEDEKPDLTDDLKDIKSDLDVAEKQHKGLVGKIEKAGGDIREECGIE